MMYVPVSGTTVSVPAPSWPPPGCPRSQELHVIHLLYLLQYYMSLLVLPVLYHLVRLYIRCFTATAKIRGYGYIDTL